MMTVMPPCEVSGASGVQLQQINVPGTAVIKWEAPPLLLVNETCPNADIPSFSDKWPELGFLLDPTTQKNPFAAPPISLMTAAELGLADELVPQVKLPSLSPEKSLNDGKVEPTKLYASINQLSCVPVVDLGGWNRPPFWPEESESVVQMLPLERSSTSNQTVFRIDDDKSDALSTRQSPRLLESSGAQSFVAARLPQFEGAECIDQHSKVLPALQVDTESTTMSKPRSTKRKTSTKCTLHHWEINPNLFEQSDLDLAMFMRSCEEEETSKSSRGDTVVLEVEADDDLIVVDQDAETYGWTFLSPSGNYSPISISSFNSAFSSMEALPLAHVDSLAGSEDGNSIDMYHFHPRIMAEDDEFMVGISKSAWESETDILVPAYFWELDRGEDWCEQSFEGGLFAVYPMCDDQRDNHVR